MNLRKLLKISKSRRYPVRRDSSGQSLRQRCFESFSQGKRPAEVARELRMERATAFTYHKQWRKLGPGFEEQFHYLKSLLRPGSPDRDRMLEQMASAGEISREELEHILARPHGLRRLMTGEIQLPARQELQRRMQSVLDVAVFISDSLAKHGMTFEDVRVAFLTLMKQYQAYRQDYDEDTKEENVETEFTRLVLDAAAEDDRAGRPRRDRLTKEERAFLMKLANEEWRRRQIMGVEMDYWIDIVRIMNEEHLTAEQAEQKIVKDLIDKGDMEGAELMRGYQDFIHNRKSAGKAGKPSGPPPPLS